MRPRHLLPLLALLACAAPAPRQPVAVAAPAASVAADRWAPLPGPSGRPLAPLPPRPWEEEVVYFVLVDRFADGDGASFPGLDRANPGAFHGGDLRGLTAHLDEIASLGATAIWVNPLVRQIPGYMGDVGFPHWPFHGYWADDLSRLDPRFGEEADLAAFVEAAHARGLRVILDVVYNHLGYGAAPTRAPTTAGYFRRPCPGGDDLVLCLAGLPDLETERPEVRDWLLDQQLPWVSRFGLDGLRLDTMRHVDHAFWQEHRRRLRALRPEGTYLIAEVWGGDAAGLDPWFEPDEADAGLDFAMRGEAIAWLSGRGRTLAYARTLVSRERVRPGHLLAHFTSSHDEEGALPLLGGDAARLRQLVTLQLTLRGIPVIFYGEEVGRRIGRWPDNRSDMPWGERAIPPGAGVPRDEGLRGFYQRLLAARRAHPALTRGGFRTLLDQGDLLAYLREVPGGDAVVVLVNRGSSPEAAVIPRPAGWGDRAVRDLAGEAPVKTGEGGAVSVSVPPHGAAILGCSSD